MTSASNYDELAEHFSLLPDADERLMFLIQLGRELPALDPAEEVDENLVRGCMSSVWLVSDRNEAAGGEGDSDTTLNFRGRSDAHIVSGLVSIVLSRFSGLSPQEVLSVDTDSILEGFGLQSELSPGRRNGLSSMIARIRQFAVEALETESQD